MRLLYLIKLKVGIMKRIVNYLTIFSMLNFVGCYYQQQMIPEEYNFDENFDLLVTTKDSSYSLSANDYYYNENTLFVTLSKFKYENGYWLRYKFITKIPVKNIEKVEIEKTDATATIWIVAGIVLIVVGIIVDIAIAEYRIN